MAQEAVTRMKAEERKEVIVDAAKVVFAQKGYRNTSITDIAKRAGVSRGTFYLHFRSKQDIFIFIIESYFASLVAILDRNHEYMVEAAKEPHNVMKVWAENLLRILIYHHQEPDLSRIIIREAMGIDTDFSERFQKLGAHAMEKVADEMRMMAEKGLIRNYDISMITSILWSSVTGIIIDFIVDGGNMDIEHLCNELVSYHARALVPGDMDTEMAVRRAAVHIEQKESGKRWIRRWK